MSVLGCLKSGRDTWGFSKRGLQRPGVRHCVMPFQPYQATDAGCGRERTSRRTRHEPGWVAKTSSGADRGPAPRGWWSAYGEPLVAQSPKLELIPTWQDSMGGPLAASANCAYLRIWEVGWGNGPLDLCGVLVRESRATWLAGAPSGRGAGPRLLAMMVWVNIQKRYVIAHVEFGFNGYRASYSQ